MIMVIVDFFAGAGGELRRKDIEALGHKYITFDIDPKFKCDFTSDIFDIEFINQEVDFVWASPPCETWSVSSIGHHWNKDNTPKTKEAIHGLNMMRHLIRLLNTRNVKWVIENPRGKLRKMPFMQEFRRKTVTYCKYGETRMKPTDLWIHGFDWQPRPICKNGDPCHVSAPRGSRTGTQGYGTYADRSVVPLQLWLEILDAAENSAPSVFFVEPKQLDFLET